MIKIDPLQAVGAVERQVRNIERDGKPAVVIVASRVYPTTLEDTWDALTNKERIPRWFMPIEGELKLGGRFSLKGNASGTITTCTAPTHLATTWENMGDVSWIDVKLTALAPERTRLVLEHTAHPPKEFWKQYGPGAVGVGWDLGLLGLGLFLDDPMSKRDVAKEGEAWAASDEGKRYIRASSDDWGRAASAAGTPDDEAKKAAEETRKFYTGEGG